MNSFGRRNFASRALTIALFALAAVVFTGLLRWTLVEYLTPFLEPFFELCVAAFLIISLVWSVIHAVKKRHQGIAVAFIPLVINLCAVLIVFFVPFTAITIDIDFRTNLNARTAVVQDVLAGKYEKQIEKAGGRGDLIALPNWKGYLSSGGGEIVRYRRQNDTLILFFSYRGILDSFSGFVYSTDDVPPETKILEAIFSRLKDFVRIGFGFHQEIRSSKRY